jgi:hypothetical protein
MADARQIGCDPIPVIVALDCAATATAQPLGQGPVIEETAQGSADFFWIFGIDQETGLPIPHRFRNAAISPGKYGYPAGGGLDQRNSKPFRRLIRQPR